MAYTIVTGFHRKGPLPTSIIDKSDSYCLQCDVHGLKDMEKDWYEEEVKPYRKTEYKFIVIITFKLSHWMEICSDKTNNSAIVLFKHIVPCTL